MKCDQCEMISINGVPCHELGCPNRNARWDADNELFVKQHECLECGSIIDAGEMCTCCVGVEDEEFLEE